MYYQNKEKEIFLNYLFFWEHHAICWKVIELVTQKISSTNWSTLQTKNVTTTVNKIRKDLFSCIFLEVLKGSKFSNKIYYYILLISYSYPTCILRPSVWLISLSFCFDFAKFHNILPFMMPNAIKGMDVLVKDWHECQNWL